VWSLGERPFFSPLAFTLFSLPEQCPSAGVIGAPKSNKRGKIMKMLVSGFALALTLAFTGPAFAQDAAAATDKASCDKAGGVWDDAAKKCNPKQ
jgi:hypothetical protein